MPTPSEHDHANTGAPLRDAPSNSRTAPRTGATVDPHFTDHLANERTYLAWIRTSLAIIGLGFIMARFSVWLRQFLTPTQLSRFDHPLPRLGLSLPAGLTLMAFGALLAVLALLRHRIVERGIARGEFHPAHGLTSLVALSVVLVAAALIVYLAFSTPSR